MSAGDADALVRWDSCPTEVLEYSLFSSHNALWAGVAHREADGCEYHPVSWSAGMRVGEQVGEPAYSKIAYSADGEGEEILRLPCRAALEDGRAGGISMSLEFLVLFFQEKSTENCHEHYPEFKIINMNARLYDPVIGRFFSPDQFVQLPEFTQSFNRYSYCLNNPLKYVDPSGNRFNPVYNKEGKPLGNTSEGFTGMPLISQGDGEHNWSSMTADAACKLDSVTTYDAVRDKLSGEAKSNIWTNIVSKLEGVSIFGEIIFSLNSIDGGIIHYSSSGDYNWGTTETPIPSSGKYQILGTDLYRSYETTVENVQASVVYHEWYGHVIKGYSDGYWKDHYQAYDAVMMSPIYSKTTPNYKSFTETQRDFHVTLFVYENVYNNEERNFDCILRQNIVNQDTLNFIKEFIQIFITDKTEKNFLQSFEAVFLGCSR